MQWRRQHFAPGGARHRPTRSRNQAEITEIVHKYNFDCESLVAETAKCVVFTSNLRLLTGVIHK